MFKIFFPLCLFCAALPLFAQEDAFLDQGRQLYAGQQWSEAEAAFREALRQQPESPTAHLWLGKTLANQQRYKDAVNALKQAIRLDKSSVDAHLELARTYLAMDEKKDARKALDQAEKLSPDHPEIFYSRGMAYGQIRLAGLRPNKVKEEFEIRRAAFSRAVELNPGHPDAYFQLGRAYELAMQDEEQALYQYAKQVGVAPQHQPALRAMVMVLIRTKQFERGLALFDQLIQQHRAEETSIIRGYAAGFHAFRFHSMNQHAEAFRAYEAYLGMLERSDPQEAGLYRDLSTVAPEDLVDRYRQAAPEERKTLWQSFWVSRDPDPTTVINERLVEHYRRVMYARLNFSEGQTPWDRRGEIYIRFGDPDDRQRFLMRSGEDVAENYIPTGKASVDAIRERNREQYKMQVNTGGVDWSQEPLAAQFTRETQGAAFAVESWVYVPFGLELFFADQIHNGKFDYPVDVTEMPAAGSKLGFTNRLAYQMFTNPRKQAELLIQKLPEAYRHDYGGEPLAFVYDLVAFRGPSGTPEVEVAFSVPSNQLGAAEDGRGAETWFNSRLALRDGNLNHAASAVSVAGPIHRPLSAKDRPELQTATFTFETRPGVFRSALAIRDSTSRRIGIFESPVAIPDYSGKELQLSDLRLASVITPAETAGPFVRHGLKITPYPARMYPQTVPVYLYYEIYNLAPNADGRTSYQMQLEITAKEEQRNFAWRLLSGVGRLIDRSSDERSVLLTFEDAGTTPDAFKHTSIDTSDSPAGTYALTLTVIDLHSGQRAAKSKEFAIVKN